MARTHHAAEELRRASASGCTPALPAPVDSASAAPPVCTCAGATAASTQTPGGARSLSSTGTQRTNQRLSDAGRPMPEGHADRSAVMLNSSSPLSPPRDVPSPVCVTPAASPSQAAVCAACAHGHDTPLAEALESALTSTPAPEPYMVRGCKKHRAQALPNCYHCTTSAAATVAAAVAFEKSIERTC